MFFLRRPGKIFVIGRNKTGTTSVGEALASLGFRVGKQSKGEELIEDWARREFSRIVKFCRTADAFQDIPFSLDYTYQILDYAFPGSKFILTIRNSSLEWYESLTRYHTKIVKKNRLPTAEDLKEFPYRKKGWIWRAQQLIYGVDEDSVYDKDLFINHYESHNKRVLHYFCHRQEDLLVLNLSKPDAIDSLCRFLNVRRKDLTMPHLNRSKENDQLSAG